MNRKNIIIGIISAILLVGIIVGASVLYSKFSSELSGGNLSALESKDTSDKGTSEEKASDSETGKDDEPDGEDYSAPDFTVIDENVNEVKLSDFKGKPVVLNFWATWCYYCKEEMPDFDEASKKHPEVQFMMVNATDGERETLEGAKKYIEDEGYSFDVFYDTKSEAVSTFYVTAFPTTYFISSEGELIARGSGMLDADSLERGIGMITGKK